MFSLLLAAPVLISASMAQAEGIWEFESQSLQVTMPKTLVLVEGAAGGGEQNLHNWKGTMDDFQLDMSLWIIPRQEWGMYDPFDVSANVAFNRRQQEQHKSFKFEEEYPVEGPFGTLPYGVIASWGEYDGTERISTQFILAGLTPERGYTFRLNCTPAPSEKARKSIEKFLQTGISFYGEVENVEWDEEEALARWERDRPLELAGKLKVLRTEHYIIFTDSSSGKLFAKEMEGCYSSIQETFPFPEVKGRKLMPVFLFRTREEYVDYYAKIAGISKESARNSKGHAWRDYYATYYDSPVDPVHIHEATHQIFSNRLRLSGGGSWFQEGVAELMSTSKNERKGFARNAARSENYTPFREFFVIPSLLGDQGRTKSGENRSTNNYAQAASIIDFARHSKFGKKKFPQFLEAVGKVHRGDVEAVEAAIQHVYDVDLIGFEAEWVKYWRE
ncbi:MAG: hypothetical protein O3A95_06050 [Planctomycetota bacterium]|nr:hypothetical protein [Planctomycetota bacterium]MDA1113845.1 hypothetical protein [Planctomycetota bacterium]